MAYKVIITEQAQQQFDRYIAYIVHQLQNRQAAKNLLADYRDTRRKLSIVAGSIKFLDNLELRSQGYKKINFQKHRYVMIFHIMDGCVVVEGIYHTLQDYENILK